MVNMSRQLKIAMLSFHSCPLGKLGGRDTGGMNVYIQEMAQELGRRGHTVDIYTRAHQPEHGQVVNIEHNVRLIHIATGGIDEIPKVAFYSYLQRFICGTEDFRNSDKIHYDLIHSHYWLSGLAGKQLQVWWHIPHILMFHTLGAAKNAIGINADEPELRTESEKELAYTCDRIVAATVREKGDLIRYHGVSPQKITVIPCGVNLDLFKPIDREIARAELRLDHQKVILFVGRLEPLKGLEQLLIALSQMKGEEMLRLVVIGGDEYSETKIQSLQEMAAKLHIQDRVNFTGAVIQERLPLFYNAADVCVIPSYYESFGMVALESLACGTPVIATDVGGMRNIISHPAAGYVVKDNSPHILASKITKVLNQKGNLPPGTEFTRSLIINYRWSNIAGMLLNEYNKSLKKYDAQKLRRRRQPVALL
jgi:D-inositol-3-phosphate glycosyltransferase